MTLVNKLFFDYDWNFVNLIGKRRHQGISNLWPPSTDTNMNISGGRANIDALSKCRVLIWRHVSD